MGLKDQLSQLEAELKERERQQMGWGEEMKRRQYDALRMAQEQSEYYEKQFQIIQKGGYDTGDIKVKNIPQNRNDEGHYDDGLQQICDEHPKEGNTLGQELVDIWDVIYVLHHMILEKVSEIDQLKGEIEKLKTKEDDLAGTKTYARMWGTEGSRS